MLRRQLCAPTKQQNVSRLDRIERNFHKMPPRSFGQSLGSARFRPVGRIRRRQFGLAAYDFTPHAAQKSETVAADALA